MSAKPETMRQGRLIGAVFTVLAIVLLSGCYADRGDEIFTAATGEDCASFVFPGFTGTPTTNASWDYIQPNIFGGRGHCTNCHSTSGAGPSNLSLLNDRYDIIVTDRLMSGYAGIDLAIIEPGSKECSFLYEKISTSSDVLASQGLGSRMPLTFPPLSNADINLIGAWIDEGAVQTP